MRPDRASNGEGTGTPVSRAEGPTDPGPSRESRPDGGSEPERTASLSTVREVYADQADRMARMSWLNRLFTGRYRQSLFGTAEGRVLDVACGTGLNLRYLPDTVEYVGIDASPEMLTKARERADGEDREVTFHEMDAQALEFEDDSFDTVISSLSTCTFPDPDEALAEMRRVCKPDGRILLVEHGRSDVGPVARFQNWRADAHFEKHACRWTQEPLAVVSEAGLTVTDVTTGTLGMLTAIEARPDS